MRLFEAATTDYATLLSTLIEGSIAEETAYIVVRDNAARMTTGKSRENGIRLEIGDCVLLDEYDIKNLKFISAYSGLPSRLQIKLDKNWSP